MKLKLLRLQWKSRKWLIAFYFESFYAVEEFVTIDP